MSTGASTRGTGPVPAHLPPPLHESCLRKAPKMLLMKYPYLLSLGALLSLSVVSPSSAQTLSNGTGGGDFATGSTWAGGTAPTTQAFNVVAGDTVIGNSGLSYSTGQNNNIFGTLTVNTGASIIMGRHNYSLTASNTGSVTNISGGTLSVDRLSSPGGSNAAINVSAGTLTIRTNIGVAATAYTITLSGGTIDSATTGFSSTLFITGGTLIMRNGIGGLGGLTTGTWNGGTIVTNTSTLGSSASSPIINAWKSNAANSLTLSSATTKQTLTLGSAVSSTQGHLGFSIYSATANDNDLLAVGANALSLTSGVNLDISGVSLGGAATDYIGSTYQLFSSSNATPYANINATISATALNIGGTTYDVTWINNLASNGSLTIASLTASTIPEPSTYAAFVGITVLGLTLYRRQPATSRSHLI
jgi:hypothetical protein